MVGPDIEFQMYIWSEQIIQTKRCIVFFGTFTFINKMSPFKDFALLAKIRVQMLVGGLQANEGRNALKIFIHVSS